MRNRGERCDPMGCDRAGDDLPWEDSGETGGGMTRAAANHIADDRNSQRRAALRAEGATPAEISGVSSTGFSLAEYRRWAARR